MKMSLDSVSITSKTTTVRCPNCGRPGERHHVDQNRLVRTECHHCDYLMITCQETGNVIEAYSPGLYAHAM
jgi:ribosomal protein L32